MDYKQLTKASLEKLPPHTLEAERSVLCALLIDPGKLPDVLSIMEPDDFYRHSHRAIFDAIRQTAREHHAVDLLTLRDTLQKQGCLDEIGGPAYLVALADIEPTAANVAYHAKLVKEKSMARKLLNNSIELATRAYDDTEPVRALIAEAKERYESLWRLMSVQDDLFWAQDSVGRADRIETDLLLRFLIRRGYSMLEINDTVLFVLNRENILSETTWVKSINKTIKDFLKTHLDDIDRPDVWRLLVNKGQLFSSAVLTGLDTLQGEFYRDDPDHCALFFQNGVLDISAARVAWKPYSDVDGYLWEDQISAHDYHGIYNRNLLSRLKRDLIQSTKARQAHRRNVIRRILNRAHYREIENGHCYDDDMFAILAEMCDQASDSLKYAMQAKRQDLMAREHEELAILDEYYQLRDQLKSEYQRFLEIVSRESVEEYTGKMIHVNNLHAFEYAIAYLIHGYNHKANMRAVVLADSNPSFVSNGRRGKGVILQALKHIKGGGVVVKEDGKAFSNGQFKFQLVRPNTRILILDDVAEDFDFSWLFSAITDAFVVESKGFKRIAFEFENTPRFVITTNHPCYDEGISSSERTVLLPVSDYFTANSKTPYQVFGHMLFDDWDADEWDRFFDYIVGLIQRYLQRPDPSVIPIVDMSIFNANKLLLKVPEPMVNYLDALQKDRDYRREDVVSDIEAFGLKFRTSNEFSRLLHTYCRLRGYKLKTNTKDGRYISNGEQFLCLQQTTPDMFDAEYQKYAKA